MHEGLCIIAADLRYPAYDDRKDVLLHSSLYLRSSRSSFNAARLCGMAAPITTPDHTIRYAMQADVPTVYVSSPSMRKNSRHAKRPKRCSSPLWLSRSILPAPPQPHPLRQSSRKAMHALCSSVSASLQRQSSDSPSTFPNYSTWTGPGIYIEDMIVTTSHRGKGYGKALMSVCARAVGGVGGVKGVNEYGMGRLQWSVLK
jgi:hypothetical protein